MERLDKLLAGTGLWSRTAARILVKTGRVTANNLRANDPGEKFPSETTLWVDGEEVGHDPMVYLMMNKPEGLISSTKDPREQTVLDLLPPHLRKLGLFPVGRLDKDAEGLLLLTNDGALAHQLLSPRRHVEKVYYVKVGGELEKADIAAFQEGIALKDGTKCMPSRLEILEPPSTALVALQEGKYHQVKRMLASRGKQVEYLKRLSMGPLALDESLKPGEFRPLREEEREKIVVLLR